MSNNKNRKVCHKKRKIIPAAEERRNLNLIQRWYKLFQQLESHSKTPLELRDDLVREILPENVYDFVKDIVPLKKFDANTIDFLESFELEKSHSLDTFDDFIPTNKKNIFNDVEELEEVEEEKIKELEKNKIDPRKEEEEEIRSGLDTTEISLGGDDIGEPKQGSFKDEKIKPSKIKNPYIKFIKKNYDEACIWREKPPIDFSDKPLVEKADNITDKIVNDFCHWLRSLGGSTDDDTRLNEKALHQMFRVGADNRDLKPICVEVKELVSVPPAVAEALKKPKMGTRNTLLSHLKHDMNEEKTMKKMVAFGTCLPPRLRKIPSLNKTRLKWAESHKRIDNIDTMERVWVDILHLRSTIGYCEFLKEDTTKKRLRPPYLEKSGCFEFIQKTEDST